MKTVLHQDVPFERHFEEICRIPHGSYHEQALSDHLVSFAKNLGLRYRQYENGNVIIYKDASPGRETEPPVMLQGHMDMVCEKVPGSEHNFETDPLDLYVENGLLRARGTTLGGDDGVAVAYMMSVLEDDTLSHPPLDCVFTVQEEVGCAGVNELEAADLRAYRMISLDDLSGDATTICAAGGYIGVNVFEGTLSAPSGTGCVLRVSGLLGGHSGEQIHLERGNAVKIAVRVLEELTRQGLGVRLCAIDGGGKPNSIPRACEARFISDLTAEACAERVKTLIEGIQEEYLHSDPELTVTWEAADPAPAFSAEDTARILAYLLLLPDGMLRHSMHLKDLTTASSNLGILRTEGGRLELTYMSRGAADSFRDEVVRKIALLSDLYGWKEISGERSPCWKYREVSPLRDLLEECYREVTGRELIHCAVHGGLECGEISNLRPEMDIVTLGPKVSAFHTYDEALDLASFAEIYRVLLRVLERM